MKTSLLTALFVSVTLTAGSLPALDTDLQQSTIDPAASETVTDVEDEIMTLEKKLHTVRQKATNAELKAQPYIFEDWDEYVKLIKESEQWDAQAKKLSSELQQLMQQRSKMLNEGR